MSRNSGQRLSVAFLYDDSLDKADGVAQYVKTLGAWLSAQGHDVSYLVGQSRLKSWEDGPVYSLSKNMRVAWGGNRLSISLLPRLKNIKRLLGERNFDVIHVQVPYSPFMAQLVINLLRPQTAVVGTVHIFPANRLAVVGTKALKRIYGKSLRRFDAMLSVSRAAQDYAEQTLKLKSQLLPNAVDRAKFRSRVTNQEDHIVFLGRLVKRKGVIELLMAFRLLLASKPNAKLTIAGSGPERQTLEAYVRRHKLQDSVTFTGQVEESDKAKLLASAAIACFPSLGGESFGVVLIEAIAAGCGVVIGGDNPGHRSVLGEELLLLVDPRNSRSFAERLELILNDETLSKRLHEWQEKQIQKYDVSVVGSQLLDIYHQAIAKRTDTRHNLS